MMSEKNKDFMPVVGPRSAERAGVKWDPKANTALSNSKTLLPLKLGHEAVVELIMLHALDASLKLTEQSGGGEVYPGFKKSLEQRMMTVLGRYDDFTAQRLARFVVQHGDAALGAVNDAPNEQTRCLACAYAVLALVDLQLIDPEQSTLAVAALGMCEEADNDRDPAWTDVKNPKSYAKIIAEKVRLSAATY